MDRRCWCHDGVAGRATAAIRRLARQKLASSGAADFWLFPAGTIWRPGRNDPWSSGRFLGSRRTGRDSTRWGDGTFVSSARRARPCALHWQLIRVFGAEWPRREQHPCGLGYGRKSSRRWFLSIRKQLLSLEPAALGFWHPNSRAPSAAALQEPGGD